MEEFEPQNAQEEEDFHLNHSDKLVGVFTEPAKTFEKIARNSIKNVDWLLPLLLMIVVSILANFVVMSNPTVKYNFIEKTMKVTKEKYDELVKEGKLTQEQADKSLEMQRRMFESNSKWLIISSVSQFIVDFIKFFIIAAIFYLLVKIFFHGEANYSATMVAYGLPYYILVIQVILIVLTTMLTDKLFTDLSIASFLNMDKQSFLGYLLSKADIFLIWFYGVVGIGLAKVNKARTSGKYVALVYATWLGFAIIAFLLAKSVPLLAGLAN